MLTDPQPHRFSSGDATGDHAITAIVRATYARLREPIAAELRDRLTPILAPLPQPQQSPQAEPVGTFTLPDGRTFTVEEP